MCPGRRACLGTCGAVAGMGRMQRVPCGLCTTLALFWGRLCLQRQLWASTSGVEGRQLCPEHQAAQFLMVAKARCAKIGLLVCAQHSRFCQSSVSFLHCPLAARSAVSHPSDAIVSSWRLCCCPGICLWDHVQRYFVRLCTSWL